jgi:hypothetical protein
MEQVQNAEYVLECSTEASKILMGGGKIYLI